MWTPKITDAIEYYTQDGADYINDFLRGKEIDGTTEENSLYWQNAIELMDTAAAILPFDTNVVDHPDSKVIRTLHRCLAEPPILGYQPSFLSTSTSLDIASQYGHYTLELTVDPNVKGIDCRDLYRGRRGDTANEDEIILERGCRIDLVRMNPDKDRWYECRVTK